MIKIFNFVFLLKYIIKIVLISFVLTIVFVVLQKVFLEDINNFDIENNTNISSILIIPEKIANYFKADEKVIEYSTIPKEVLLVYEDLENRFNDDSIDNELKNDEWKLKKAEETAAKYDLSLSNAMQLYIKVKNSHK